MGAINPAKLKASVVSKLEQRKQKAVLSPQAEAVLEVFAETINALIEAKKKPSENAIRQLTDAFVKGWQEKFGGPYKFNGAADGKAAAELIKLKLTPEQVMDVAKKAWERTSDFNCKHAMTLRGLHGRFNEIRQEVGALNGHKRELDEKF